MILGLFGHHYFPWIWILTLQFSDVGAVLKQMAFS